MKKKKILFLLEGFDKGGIEQVTLDIVNHLDPEKYDITVQTFWYGGHCQSLVHSNITVKPFFFKRYVRGIIRLIAYLTPKMLYRLFIHGDYDVEIAASDGGAAKVISGSTNKKAKNICWVHMDVVNRGSGMKEFKNAETAFPVYSKFDVIVPVSEACRERFEEKFGSSYNIQVKRNPLPVSDILKKAIDDPEIAFDDGLNFVCIGRLEEQKGFDRLITAVAKIKATTNKPFHVYIVGAGTKHDDLVRQINKLNLSEDISLLGFQANPYPYLKAADAFLLSSRDEAFPLVIGESLIVGTPVIATRCCGVDEWLSGGKYGMILENSTDGIYNGLLTVLRQPEILDVYKSRIPEAQEKISFEKSMSEFEELLNV